MYSPVTKTIEICYTVLIPVRLLLQLLYRVRQKNLMIF